MKKCTKICVDKFRESKEKKNKKEDKKKTKNSKNFMPKTKNSNNIERKNASECLYTNELNKKFCGQNVDLNSKDYRKKSIDECLKYFCPICCEEFTTSFFSIFFS